MTRTAWLKSLTLTMVAVGWSLLSPCTGFWSPAPAAAQLPAAAPGGIVISPDLHRQDAIAIGQAPPRDDLVPTDLTPVRLPERASPFDTLKMEALYRLPSRMFLSATCENTLRLETNILQTMNHNKPDGIYRVLPNVTLGYALRPTTRVAANYFFLRDTYMDHTTLNRGIHSVGFRVDQDIRLPLRMNMTTGFFARELFVQKYAALSDLLPSVTITRGVGQHGLIYTSIIGQIRFRKVFAHYQEFDQFYSFGGIYRRGLWNAVFDTTFINNFGKRALRLGPNNTNIVMTMEIGRQLSRRIPLTAFVRCEPIFNIGASQAPGFAGVNVRVFGGIRAEVNKAAVFPLKLEGL